MNRAEMQALLDAERVRRDSYSYDGSVPDECLCLLPVAGGWTVFNSERGGRTGERVFETEDEACTFMVNRLIAASGNRRAD